MCNKHINLKYKRNEIACKIFGSKKLEVSEGFRALHEEELCDI
jgi:hypothetical protein